ncbi:hypothetical protein GCM10022197_03360 [Microlunatus spumicola]|uniref:Cardiolipin synthase N-terminal domain-containing protein n=1 Tax=Microlunatus spumicola TaxID=81499 RepID=A0ABP6WL83_9ACTN
MNISHLLLLFLVGVASTAGAVLWVSTLVSVLRNAAAWRAVVWVAVTFVFPVLGPVVWFVVGRAHERVVNTGTYAGQDSHVLAH